MHRAMASAAHTVNRKPDAGGIRFADLNVMSWGGALFVFCTSILILFFTAVLSLFFFYILSTIVLQRKRSQSIHTHFSIACVVRLSSDTFVYPA